MIMLYCSRGERVVDCGWDFDLTRRFIFGVLHGERKNGVNSRKVPE